MTTEQSDQKLKLIAKNGQYIVVTVSASEKFSELSEQMQAHDEAIQENDAENHVKAVRIFIAGGGCSGMQYGMTYSDAVSKYDHVIKAQSAVSKKPFEIVIDSVALDYMNLAEIDYEDNGLSSTFVFNNVFEAIGGSGACGGCGSAM